MSSTLGLIFFSKCLIMYFCTSACSVQIKECLKLSSVEGFFVLNASIYSNVFTSWKNAMTGKVPEGPESIMVNRERITWLMKGWRYVHYFLLKISYTSMPRPKLFVTHSEYALIKIANVSFSVFYTTRVEYTCLSVTSSVLKIEINLWTLGDILTDAEGVDDPEKRISAEINSYNHASSFARLDEISLTYAEENRKADLCICSTEFKVNFKGNGSTRSMVAKITRASTEYNLEIKTEVFLIAHLHNHDWQSKNRTEISFKPGESVMEIPYDLNILTGKEFKIKVIPFCPLGFAVSCGLEEPFEWNSEETYIVTKHKTPRSYESC